MRRPSLFVMASGLTVLSAAAAYCYLACRRRGCTPGELVAGLVDQVVDGSVGRRRGNNSGGAGGRRRAPPPLPMAGAASSAAVNSVLSVLSHAALLHADAIENDVRCGSTAVPAARFVALHVAAVAAADQLVLEGPSAKPRRALAQLVAGGCAVGVVVMKGEGGGGGDHAAAADHNNNKTAADPHPYLPDKEVEGTRLLKLLRMSASPDVVDVLETVAGRAVPLGAVSPLYVFVARVLASLAVDGCDGCCPLDAAQQDAISTAVVGCCAAVLSAAVAAHDEPLAGLREAVRGVVALLVAPFGDLEGLLKGYLPANTTDSAPAGGTANGEAHGRPGAAGRSAEGGDSLFGGSVARTRQYPAALVAASKLASVPAKSAAASSGSPLSPTNHNQHHSGGSSSSTSSSRSSEVCRSVLHWMERLRTQLLHGLLAESWIADAVRATAGSDTGGLRLLHAAAAAVGSPQSAASGDEPLRRLSALLAIAEEPFAILVGRHGPNPIARAPPPPTAIGQTGSASYRGENVLHALVRPLTAKATALAQAVRSNKTGAFATLGDVQREAAAFEALAQHVLLATTFVLGRCNDTTVRNADERRAAIKEEEQRAAKSSNKKCGGSHGAAADEVEGSTIMVGANTIAASVTTQHWLQVGEAPEARRKVVVSAVDEAGLTPYLIADNGARLLQSAADVLPAAQMAERMEAICACMGNCDYDVV